MEANLQCLRFLFQTSAGAVRGDVLIYIGLRLNSELLSILTTGKKIMCFAFLPTVT